MKRTGEKALSIIAAVLNFFGTAILILLLIGSNQIVNDPLFQEEMDQYMTGTGATEAEIILGIDYMDQVQVFINSVGWVFIVLSLIGLVLTIIGAVKVNANAKLSGILFIIASLLSGLLSLPGILLLIAAIMCFVRKPKITTPTTNEIIKTDENGYTID